MPAIFTGCRRRTSWRDFRRHVALEPEPPAALQGRSKARSANSTIRSVDPGWRVNEKGRPLAIGVHHHEEVIAVMGDHEIIIRMPPSAFGENLALLAGFRA